MVGIQQGLNKGLDTILSFGAKSVRPELLEQMLIGRTDTVDLLHKMVSGFAMEGLNQQVLVIGPRGSGKTHIIRVLYHRIQSFLIEGRIAVAYFSEDEYGIAGYLDLLIRVINSFIRWHREDTLRLQQSLDNLRNSHKNLQEETAEKIIWDYIGDRPLLILAENFDMILESIGAEGQNKLRALLYRHNKISIIASAQAMSKDIGKEDKPFYNFFTLIYLKKLTYEESLLLLETMAKVDGRKDIVSLLHSKGRYQIMAIHEMVKGNHRLLITFYEFLRADTLANLSTLFIKTMNDLKPYYESFIRYLPPQEQKILYYLAMAKTARRGSEVAKDCFIADKSISKLLSELQRKKLIESYTDPESKRDKLYDIAEPLLRIGIEIGEHREGVVGLFVDFLALYYSMDELNTQIEQFEQMCECEANPKIKQNFFYELEARSRAIEIKKKIPKERTPEYNYLMEIYALYEEERYQEFINLSTKIADHLKDVEYHFKVGYAYLQVKDLLKSIAAYLMASELGPQNVEIFYNLGSTYADAKEWEKAVKAFQRALELNPRYLPVYNNLGIAYSKLEKFDSAYDAYKTAIKLNPNEYLPYYNWGLDLLRRREFNEGTSLMEKALELEPHESNIYHSLGLSYIWQGKKSKAINILTRFMKVNFRHAFYMFLHHFPESYSEIKMAILESIQKDNIESVFAETIIKGLQAYQNWTEEKIGVIERIIQEVFHSAGSLLVIKKYVETFHRYGLNKENKAIYELPKEQREFFLKEIIEKRNKAFEASDNNFISFLTSK